MLTSYSRGPFNLARLLGFQFSLSLLVVLRCVYAVLDHR